MPTPDQVYFHAPCFDGIVSAVLVSDFVEHSGGKVRALHPVNYGLREAWLSMDLGPASAVVDFLYHPQASLWVDHHVSAFLSPKSRADFQRHEDSWHVYADDAASCAGLLSKHLEQAFGYRNDRLRELAGWADKTDSAAYNSVDEAIFGDAPALRINASLATDEDGAYSVFLVQSLLESSVDEVARQPEVSSRYLRYRHELEKGLERFKASSRYDGGIVVFDTSAVEVPVPRYAPYLYFPDARYSIGVTRTAEKAKISAMQNPWRRFVGLDLGKTFERFGGGGHERVASVELRGDDRARADIVLGELIDTLTEPSRPAARVSEEPAK
jgi:hypothetical protein